MPDETSAAVRSEVIEFPEGSVTIYEHGSIRFFFRSMNYVYARGADHEEGMDIVVPKESADAIKRHFERERRGY
ncbi:MAG: hypothetical protein Q8R02_23325 [Hyphomonadaceae bacterium]|nr:hypothetical protein [Hyphomonadaceae bacterium]